MACPLHSLFVTFQPEEAKMVPTTLPRDRRALPRLSTEERILLCKDDDASDPVVADCVDLSPGGVRVRLSSPLPEVGSVLVRVPTAGDAELAELASVGRVSEDRRETVLLFRESVRVIPWLHERASASSRAVDGAPLGRATAELALQRATDTVSLLAILARGAAAFADRARVCWAGEQGWTPVVESDGRELRWGARLEGQRPQGVLIMVPVGDELLLVVEGQARPQARQGLERLASHAAGKWQVIEPTGRRFLAWCALRPRVRSQMLDGLEHRSAVVRQRSAELLQHNGVDTLGYAPDLSRRARARLRREIEEMASFREWWLENVTDVAPAPR